jgi:hypothetical protein
MPNKKKKSSSSSSKAASTALVVPPPSVPRTRAAQEAALEDLRRGNLGAVLTLVAAGGSPDTQVQLMMSSKAFSTPRATSLPLLHFVWLNQRHVEARRHRHYGARLFQGLIDAGAQLNSFCFVEGSTRTLLMLESEFHECDELFPMLMAKGADPWLHAPDDGETALHLASQLGRTEKCAMLLAVKGERSVDLLNGVGVTPLMKAAAFGHLQTGNC